jgi:hypothetical protein
VSGIFTFPATYRLFKSNGDAKLLSGRYCKCFHIIVTRLLYLAKCVRVDILLAVSFLTTRVQSPTEEDQSKLLHVFKYLSATKVQALVLRPTDELRIEGYVHAAFGYHGYGKSHQG